MNIFTQGRNQVFWITCQTDEKGLIAKYKIMKMYISLLKALQPQIKTQLYTVMLWRSQTEEAAWPSG